MAAKVIAIAPANAYRLAAQTEKARKMFELLRDNGLAHVVSRLGGMEEDQWAMLAAAARVNMPSAATREMVVRLCWSQENS